MTIPEQAWAPRRVLCAVDLAPRCPSVLAPALALAARFDAELELLRVVEDGTISDGVERVVQPGHRAAHPEGIARCRQIDDLRTLMSCAPKQERARLRGRVETGEVIPTILRAAEQADLVVMGTHGRSGLERVLLGSVAQEVVRAARCPVLTVKRGGAPFFPRAMQLELRDGTPVLLRPLVPEDKEPLRQGLGRLSARSRYRRFMAPIRDFTDAQLETLTEIDYRDHMAWAAIGLTQGEEVPLGVARYVRLVAEPTVAEAAVAVVDCFQGRGLGTLLLSAINCSAALNGVETFRAYVLEENAPMRSIIEGCGAGTGPAEEGCLQFELPVPRDVKQLPNSPLSKVLKAVAREMSAPPAVGFLQRESIHTVAAALARLFK